MNILIYILCEVVASICENFMKVHKTRFTKQ